MSPQKLRYFADSLAKRLGGGARECPSCGFAGSSTVDRKYLVTTLERCQRCQLLFRVPTTSAGASDAFYQSSYRQGFTTDLPSDAALAQYLSHGFPPERNYGAYIAVLSALGCMPGARILDFGCSWGYGTWQLRRAGFRVQGLEVSKGRSRFAREKLGVDVVPSLGDVAAPLDVFFSAHVLEHLPSPLEAIRAGLALLKPGGFFVAFTPNGSAQFRAANRLAWHRLWGMVHPQLIDDRFYDYALAGRRYLLASSPYEPAGMAEWLRGAGDSARLDLSGGELLCLARA
jgi:2-polyprenyl-3-methyl-5-hydroxy-6-metoxy-1,4-benzoquinol methylase